MSVILDHLKSFVSSPQELHCDRKGLSADLIQYWSGSIGQASEITQYGPDAVIFRSEVSKIRVRGLGVIPAPCLILGRLTDASQAAITELVRSTDVGRILGFVVCLSSEAFRHLRGSRQLPPDCAVVLSNGDLQTMVSSADPLQVLKRYVQNQIPLKLLVPFSTSDSAIGNMFIGRQWELESMAYESQDFALCGLGGMGKSTLLQQVKWIRRQKRYPRAARFVFVDLLSCKPDLDAAAREIATQVGKTKIAYETNLSNFDASLRKLKYQDPRFRDGPIDLVLDELGSILTLDRDLYGEDGKNYQLMRKLKHARNLNIIRLTVSARTETDALLSDSNNPFVPDGNGILHHASRLKLLKLNALSDTESLQLLLNPLRDLGYPVDENYTELVRRLRECQGIPAQVQNLGLDIVEEFSRKRHLTC